MTPPLVLKKHSEHLNKGRSWLGDRNPPKCLHWFCVLQPQKQNILADVAGCFSSFGRRRFITNSSNYPSSGWGFLLSATRLFHSSRWGVFLLGALSMHWMREGADWVLKFNRRKLGRVFPDDRYPGMWRSRRRRWADR
jgi:hypothetical protein